MDNSVKFKNEKYEDNQVKAQNKFLSRVYLWMTLALCISGATAFYTAKNIALFNFLFANGSKGFLLLCVIEIVLVWFLSFRIRKMSAVSAFAAFLAYSVVNGLTLSSIFYIYNLSSIITVFFISAVMFLLMAFYGSVTKTNLNSFRRYFTMALIGILIASLVNLLLHSSGIDRIISYASVLLFTGLTAYDAQKMYKASLRAGKQNEDVFQKASILGALELYLDFINVFLSLLRIFGNRNK